MYDPDRYDAEIILDRMGEGSFTTDVMQRIFGCSRPAIQRAITTGKLPQPRKVPRSSTAKRANGFTQNEWDRQQVIDVLARQLTTPKKHPRAAFA